MARSRALWDRIRRPRGPIGRALKRIGTSALGTYGAYVVYGLRHRPLLRSSVTAAERAAALPGDAIVSEPSWVSDFGTDIAVEPAVVWPWLVQLGYGRAGWYTWFPLDNGGVASANAIVPELQALAVGDTVPDGPRAAEGFGVWRVRELDPPRALVLHSRRRPVDGRELAPGEAGSGIDCSWAFVLAEPRAGHTRLRVRVRARLEGDLGGVLVARAVRGIFGLGDNVMENSMLAGIRRRAERRPPRPSAYE